MLTLQIYIQLSTQTSIFVKKLHIISHNYKNRLGWHVLGKTETSRKQCICTFNLDSCKEMLNFVTKLTWKNNNQ